MNTALTLGEDVPFAYLNYMLFDADNQLVDAGWQRVTVDAGFCRARKIRRFARM